MFFGNVAVAQNGATQTSYYVAKEMVDRFPRIPAEYEPQRALMVSLSDWQPHHSPIFTQVVQKTKGHVDLVVLFNDRKQLQAAIDWIDQAQLDASHVHFSQIDLDTIWVRDFAPIFRVTKEGSLQALDFYYVGGLRPKDDVLPKKWAELTDARYVEAPWTIQGGNLLCNGKSLGVTTNRIFKDNYISFQNTRYSLRQANFERRKIVTNALLKLFNLKLLVVLEPLQYEHTQHCDMFTTFVADDQVIVASLDRARDPLNAAILDRNADRLSKIKIGDRPLQVHRIEIPTRQGTSWSAYTNAIIANTVVLIPVFDTDSPQLVKQAVSTYQRLLPDHKIETIDMTSMKQLQGELHCLSVHLPKEGELPSNAISFSKAKQLVKP